MSIHAKGTKTGQALKVALEQDVWTWVTIVGTDKKSIVAYQDGKEVAKGPGVDFDNRLPLNDISIGANSFDERRRTFNGSFSIVRVYDRALTADRGYEQRARRVPSRRAGRQALDDVGEIEKRFIMSECILPKRTWNIRSTCVACSRNSDYRLIVIQKSLLQHVGWVERHQPKTQNIPLGFRGLMSVEISET